jgi:hypothetical protein
LYILSVLPSQFVNQTLLRLVRALQHQPSLDPLDDTPDS